MGRELIQKRGKWAVIETVSDKEQPVTPFFKTKKEIVDYLVDHGEDYTGDKYSRQAVEAFLEIGSVPSMILTRQGLLKNYECALDMKKEGKP